MKPSPAFHISNKGMTKTVTSESVFTTVIQICCPSGLSASACDSIVERLNRSARERCSSSIKPSVRQPTRRRQAPKRWRRYYRGVLNRYRKPAMKLCLCLLALRREPSPIFRCQPDFVDALIVAIEERLNITLVLSLDLGLSIDPSQALRSFALLP